MKNLIKMKDKNKRVMLAEIGYDFGLTKEEAEAVLFELLTGKLYNSTMAEVNKFLQEKGVK